MRFSKSSSSFFNANTFSKIYIFLIYSLLLPQISVKNPAVLAEKTKRRLKFAEAKNEAAKKLQPESRRRAEGKRKV
jgi:hypothetical protein